MVRAAALVLTILVVASAIGRRQLRSRSGNVVFRMGSRRAIRGARTLTQLGVVRGANGVLRIGSAMSQLCSYARRLRHQIHLVNKSVGIVR